MNNFGQTSQELKTTTILPDISKLLTLTRTQLLLIIRNPTHSTSDLCRSNPRKLHRQASQETEEEADETVARQGLRRDFCTRPSSNLRQRHQQRNDQLGRLRRHPQRHRPHACLRARSSTSPNETGQNPLHNPRVGQMKRNPDWSDLSEHDEIRPTARPSPRSTKACSTQTHVSSPRASGRRDPSS